MRILLACSMLSLVLLLQACPQTPQHFIPTLLDDPTGGPASSPRLSGGSDGELILSWLQADGESVALRYSQFEDGRWSEAATVIEKDGMFANWADLPSVVPLGDKHLAAHWLQQSEGDWYSYDIWFTQSFDDGATWSSPFVPHTDSTPTEHGFVSMYPINGSVGLVWLDGRKMLNEVLDDPTGSGMTLRAAVVGAGQSLSEEQLVDDLICDCCQTDVALAESGPIAVYRNRSVDEIRDIFVTRQIDGKWQTGKPLASDNWKIAGCPVNGPSISADGNRVAVAWFTAAQEPLVSVAISTDSGESFSDPIEIIRGETLGRVATVLLDDGELAVSWLAVADSEFSAVKIRRVMQDATLGPIRVVASAATGFAVPQIVRVNSELVLAWTEKRDDGVYVSTASIAIDSL